MNIADRIRPHLRSWKPYSSARSEFEGEAQIFLDANESPYPSSFNRYPDPLQKELRAKLAEINSIDEDEIFLGNGSDEVLDLIIRLFCVPGYDRAVIMPPTYGMYKVLLNLNNIGITEIPLTSDFQIDTPSVLDEVREGAKMVFICSPNNPTGNQMSLSAIKAILSTGVIVVIDQAYIEFAEQDTAAPLLRDFPNLIITQTLSKAYGLAGLRIGLGLAHKDFVDLLNAIKPPYNISLVNAGLAREALNKEKIEERVLEIRAQRELLREELTAMTGVKDVFPSSSNFLLVRFDNAQEVFLALRTAGVVVRDRSSEYGCDNCLRLSVGTPEENSILIDHLKRILS